MPTMSQLQVYNIIAQWTQIPAGSCYERWKQIYNFLPPPPPDASDKWAEAAQIAAAYTGPPIT